MSMQMEVNTYLLITATLGNQDVAESHIIREALISKKPSLLRMEWEILTQMAKDSAEIEVLEQRQQDMRQYLKTMQLSLHDLQLNTPKNLSDAQLEERQQKLQSLSLQLEPLQKQLQQLEREVVILQDQLQETQRTFREKVTQRFAELNIIHQTQIQDLLDYLHTLNIGTETDQIALQQALLAAVHHPDVESEMITSYRQITQTPVSLGQKLKQWINAPKFISKLQQKIVETLSATSSLTSVAQSQE